MTYLYFLQTGSRPNRDCNFSMNCKNLPQASTLLSDTISNLIFLIEIDSPKLISKKGRPRKLSKDSVSSVSVGILPII